MTGTKPPTTVGEFVAALFGRTAEGRLTQDYRTGWWSAFWAALIGRAQVATDADSTPVPSAGNLSAAPAISTYQPAVDPDVDTEQASASSTHVAFAEEATVLSNIDQELATLVGRPAPGQFGPYVLTDMLGSGTMGVVYRAVDTRRNRTVALKLLPPKLATDEYRNWFRREAAAIGRIDEPHVVPIRDAGEIDGQLYLDMPLIEGTDLATLLDQDGPPSPSRAVAIVSQVAGALDAAHRTGVIHGDVKTSNILISGSQGVEFAWLTGFSIARGDDSTRLTSSNAAAVGTLAYIAPEQFNLEPTNPATDIYSLGCVFFEILTGDQPFADRNSPEMMYAHLHEIPPRPSARRRGVPVELDAVVARSMAKNPADRYRNARELAAAAETAIGRS